SEPLVELAGALVVALDIKAQSAGIVARLCLLMNVLIERLEHAARTPVCADIDALNPPEESIAPVAPLEGDHQLTDNFASGLGDPVGSFVPVGEHCIHAGPEARWIELQVLGFQGEPRVEPGDDWRIGGSGRA